MHAELVDIPRRILDVAIGALTQANQHAVYYDPGMDHWTDMSVLNASMAGELFLKAIVAKEHPLLIFRDLFQLDDPSNLDLSLKHIIERGRTYNLEHMPKLLWVTTGERLPDPKSFEELRRARNAVQHFCSPTNVADLRKLSLTFIYNNIDPLIKKHFNLFAIEYHEDTAVSYDYVVDTLIQKELLFSVPTDFKVTEIKLSDALHGCSAAYKKKLAKRFKEAGLNLKEIMEAGT